MPLSPSQPNSLVTRLPAVAVTATTESIRGVLRVRANASYTDSLHSAHLRPFKQQMEICLTRLPKHGHSRVPGDPPLAAPP